jgi:hypothetical protein
MPQPVHVWNNEAEHRFQVDLENRSAMLVYQLRDDQFALVHTEVPPEYSGKGIAAALVKSALEHARAAGLRVVPRCAYVVSYLRRHPEEADVVDPEYREPRRRRAVS